jgi:hypothetical protein
VFRLHQDLIARADKAVADKDSTGDRMDLQGLVDVVKGRLRAVKCVFQSDQDVTTWEGRRLWSGVRDSEKEGRDLDGSAFAPTSSRSV